SISRRSTAIAPTETTQPSTRLQLQARPVIATTTATLPTIPPSPSTMETTLPIATHLATMLPLVTTIPPTTVTMLEATWLPSAKTTNHLRFQTTEFLTAG